MLAQDDITHTPALCRDCLETFIIVHGDEQKPRCPKCRSPRVLAHPELHSLSIAHMDCDAFYASIEKRDRPELANKPLIVGGGARGVVSTCCYIARTYGIRSAMPMFKALAACPDAVVLSPDIAKYRKVSRQIRAFLDKLTPAVEPLSLDEAFLDMTGTSRLHHASPAVTLAALAKRVECEIEITVSIGLSYNKFLAKVASDLKKPRGFAIIGRAEALDFLASQPVSMIWGVGKAMNARLARDGITRISQLQKLDETDLMRRYGVMGLQLARLSRGQDNRHVASNNVAKSISAERTFETDHRTCAMLEKALWPLCEKVSQQLKGKGIAGRTVNLKLKTYDFRLRTRSITLEYPTQLAETLYRYGIHLLVREVTGDAFRLLGIGVSDLCGAAQADPPDLVDPVGLQKRKTEQTIDKLREKFGKDVIRKGRGL